MTRGLKTNRLEGTSSPISEVLSVKAESLKEDNKMKKANYYCSQCGKKCKQISQEAIDYVFICQNGHKWSVTIDVEHPTTGGQIMGFQCAGARAIDYFNNYNFKEEK